MVFSGNPEYGSGTNSGLLQTSGKFYGREGFQYRIQRARKQTRLLTGDNGGRTGGKILHSLLTRTELFLLCSKHRTQPVHVCPIRMGSLPGK
jgi:hypothetical protein